MPKIAIITRTYNRPLFLKRAIQSVAAQTFDDYIHVIINDGGDKAQLQAIIDAADDGTHAKIKVFHRAHSSGAPDTLFSESIDRVDSEYVAIHDDDDTWHPELLARAVDALDSGSAGVVVRADNVYEKVAENKIIETKRDRFLPEMRAVSLYSQCLDNQLSAGCFIYRRSAYEAVGKYDDTLPILGDWEFGIRFLLKFDVDYLDPGYALAFYHRRNSDKSTSFGLYDHRTYLTRILNEYLRADLDSGKLGVGYIMNDLRYEQDMITSNVRRLLPKPLVKLIRKRVR